MALTDTIGHPLEVFASKSSTEAKKTAFTSAHPGAISFTTDGKIVFGGKEWGGTPTSEIDAWGLTVKGCSPLLVSLLGLDWPNNNAPLGGILHYLGSYLSSNAGGSAGHHVSDAREMEFSNAPATYMPNASGLLGSNILYQGVWLGSIIDEMCKKIQAIQNKVK